MIDLFYPYIPEEAVREVVDTLRTRWIGQGPKVDRFEEEFSKMFGLAYVVFLNSGTSSLEMAYELLKLGPGDEVISSPLTCTATNIPLLRRKVKIIWADITEKTLCIDPIDVRSKLTSKTKAVVQVHLGGIKADCGVQHVPVVSDACQALGIFTGDFTCCSFQAIKHITTGDGGVLVIDKDYKGNAERARNNARMMRWFGIDRRKKIKNRWQAYKERQMTFDIKLLGFKWQPTDIAAALGLAGLKNYHYVLGHRRELFEVYKEHLKGVDGIRLVDGPENTCWLCTVLVERRDDFARMLFEAGVDTNMVQLRNDIYKIFGGKRADLPVMNMVEEKYLSIPLGTHVTKEQVEYICDTIKKGW